MGRLMNTLIRVSRNKCRSLVLLVAFTSVASYAAPPWPWQWQYDSKVLVGNRNPQVSGGPAIAANGGPNVPDADVGAVAVYPGEGGKNVWYSYTNLTDLPPLQWYGNKAIKEGTAHLTSISRPAIAWIGENNTANPGVFMMIVPKHGVFETWKYKTDTWKQPGTWMQLKSGPIYQSESASDYGDPALADGSDRTHLLICDSSGNLLWFTKDHSYDDDAPWVLQPRIASGKSPSMVSLGSTMFAIYWDTDKKAWFELTLKPGERAWESHKINPNGPVPNQGAALVVAKGQIFIVYTAKGSDMKFAPLNADSSIGTPGGLVQPVSSNGNTAATKNAIGAAVMQSAKTTPTVVVVHQGKSSKNLWFAIAK